MGKFKGIYPQLFRSSGWLSHVKLWIPVFGLVQLTIWQKWGWDFTGWLQELGLWVPQFADQDVPQPTMEMKGSPMLKVTHTDPQMAHFPSFNIAI